MPDETRTTRTQHPGHPGHSAGQPGEEDPEKGFLTDQDPLADTIEQEADPLSHEPSASAAVISPPREETEPTPPAAEPDLSVLDVRPTPGPPRDYHFPSFERIVLSSGLTLLTVDLPGRPLLAAQLVLAGGGAAERPERAGVTALTARALTEGTRRLDAIEFVEASERLGAELHAETTWEASSATLEVPRSRFAPALGLLAEMVLEPRFPADEIERLREERLNDLLQVRADPRRRAERVFPETIYDPDVPYSRPLGGVETTVGEIDREAVTERHRQMLEAGRATLIVAGDLAGLEVARLAQEHFGGWSTPALVPPDPPVRAHPARARVVLVDRPGSPQAEVRIGHVGLPRRTPDFHAVAVLNAILGGTFGARLNRVLREERGYTYGVHSSFEMRRSAGPFVVRTGVETAVAVPAIIEALSIVRGMGEAEVEQRELDTVRDYLVGVFPLRFEGSAAVAAALAGLAIFELPDDELDLYRPRIAAVEVAHVLAAARRHIRPAELSVVVVGDAAMLEQPLRAEITAPLELVTAEVPVG